MKKYLLVLMLFCLISNPLQSNENSDNSDLLKLGLYGSYCQYYNIANFDSFNSITCNSTRYPNNFDDRISIGTIINLKISQNVEFESKILYSPIKVTFVANESTIEQIDERLIFVVISNNLEVAINYINFDLLFKYNLTKYISFKAGGTFALEVGNNFHQFDKLISPDSLEYYNNPRIWNNYSGEIPDINPIIPYLTVGFDVLIPLNQEENWYILPELSYSHPMNGVVKDLDWNIYGLRFGASLLYRFGN